MFSRRAFLPLTSGVLTDAFSPSAVGIAAALCMLVAFFTMNLEKKHHDD